MKKILTSRLSGLDTTNDGGWSLWILCSFNLPDFDFSQSFRPRMTLNKLDKKYLYKFARYEF